ncbi:uncharacterized protein BJX67DRAFT_370302 [Aspergillus lucknowensis]|uniref:Glycoside hydrolase family 43 protein n=1 Tax=Aspergillus lucknowensis TaxID=176173 RepID=A0ABR4M0M4_9EURO
MRWQQLAILAPIFSPLATAQSDDLSIGNGYLTLSTANFELELVKDAQVLASLKPSSGGAADFDFLPFDLISSRAANGQYHNGDITFRYRISDSEAWVSADSSQDRQPVASTDPRGSDVLAAANLTATLPAGSPLGIVRQWLDVDGDLGLSFTITNNGAQSVEVGSLGFPTEFNSIFTGRTADDMAAKCSLTDPYIGLDAGYLQVVPTAGTGPALIVTPLANTSTPFEAWRNLVEPVDDTTAYQSQTFEGFYEWQTHTKAYAEDEWASVTPWNPPTSRTLSPGQSTTVGLRFSLVADGVRAIQAAVQTTQTPLTIGTGYIVPQDLTVHLYTFYDAAGISEITSDDDGLEIIQESDSNHISLTPTGSVTGRSRVTITYANNKTQTVHYFLLPGTAPETIALLGSFSTTAMWFTDETDPFGRAPSILTYDASTESPVTQEPRVWIAGLSDEGGTVYLATAMKQSALPDASEIEKLEQFATDVLFANIQDGGSNVRKSLFFYEPEALPEYEYDPDLEWGNWWSWNQADSYATNRAYNYIHPVGAYWALYRAGRDDPSVLSLNDWEWYLRQAVNTTLACFATDEQGNELVGYSRLGLMGETVVGELLHDLQREGWTTEADAVEEAMRLRAEEWDGQSAPFGSEMAWDSTGQEGVYYWSSYFNLSTTATKTVNSVLGFMPTVSHWGWNGNARRYWDFIYAGKLQRIERMIHHYGSSLNALPLLSQFRQSPSDTHLLRVGYGGITGPLSNIRADGSMYNAFHSFPDTLQGDEYSGDYGQGFLGVMLGSGVYVVKDPDMGLVAYGGNLEVEGSVVTVYPRDAVRRRVYVASLGVYVTLSAGRIESFSFDEADLDGLDLTITSGPAGSETAVVWVESPGSEGEYIVEGGEEVRGGKQFAISADGTVVTVVAA